MFSIEQGKLLSELSTIGIGGEARYFVKVNSQEEMREAILFAYQKSLPFLVLGKGSNSLFPDEGFPGLAILNQIEFCQFIEEKIYVGSGYSFSRLGVQSAKKGLGGLEFASGIPASVGGAIFMNAGANGQETFDSLEEVEFIDEKGTFFLWKKEELSFGYRFSCFQKKKGAIVAARFSLSLSKKAREEQIAILHKRMQSQPLKEKSAGCAFRNPKGISAGALIEQCGLKGAKVGDAIVSQLHANFIINQGKASAKDVLSLLEKIEKTVYEKTGTVLEREIRWTPYDNFSS